MEETVGLWLTAPMEKVENCFFSGWLWHVENNTQQATIDTKKSYIIQWLEKMAAGHSSSTLLARLTSMSETCGKWWGTVPYKKVFFISHSKRNQTKSSLSMLERHCCSVIVCFEIIDTGIEEAPHPYIYSRFYHSYKKKTKMSISTIRMEEKQEKR